MYVATPDGKLLTGGYNCVETLPQFRALLKKALGDYKPAKVAVIRPGKSSPFVKPPEGGLVVNVYAKVLGNYKESDYFYCIRSVLCSNRRGGKRLRRLQW